MAHCQTERTHDIPDPQQCRTAQIRCCAAKKRVWLVCSGCSLHGSCRSTGEIYYCAVISRRSTAASTKRAVFSRRSYVSSCCSAFSGSTHVFGQLTQTANWENVAGRDQNNAVRPRNATAGWENVAFPGSTHAFGHLTQTANWENVAGRDQNNAGWPRNATANWENASLRPNNKPAAWENALLTSHNTSLMLQSSAAITRNRPATPRRQYIYRYNAADHIYWSASTAISLSAVLHYYSAVTRLHLPTG